MEQKLVLSQNSSNIPVLDLVDSVMTVICSSKSDDELQTEVQGCEYLNLFQLLTKFVSSFSICLDSSALNSSRSS